MGARENRIFPIALAILWMLMAAMAIVDFASFIGRRLRCVTVGGAGTRRAAAGKKLKPLHARPRIFANHQRSPTKRKRGSLRNSGGFFS